MRNLHKLTVAQCLVRADILLQEAAGRISPNRPEIKRVIEEGRRDINDAMTLLEIVDSDGVRYGPVPHDRPSLAQVLGE